jgi:uncharacterized protein YodC (DUF2158 family)
VFDRFVSLPRKRARLAAALIACEACGIRMFKKNLAGSIKPAAGIGVGANKRAAQPSLAAGRRASHFKMEFNMSPSTKELSIAIAVALGFGLAAPLSAAAFDAAPQPRATAQDPSAAGLRSGDLVRVRSGGPLMTVTSVQGDQAQCAWTDGATGALKSEAFPVAVLGPQVTPAPDNAGYQRDKRTADAYYRKHCPSGSVSIEGRFECAY